MRFGYYDRAARQRLMILPKEGQADLQRKLFRETPAEYAQRFFAEVRGLGYCGLVLIRGNKVRTIALRDW